jgi:hypothetical protein
MKTKTKIKWLVLILVLMSLLTGFLSGQVGYGKILHGDFCTRCGARRDSKAYELRLFNLSKAFGSSTKITPSAITTAWEDYAGGCPHDWIFDYTDRLSFLVSSYADSFTRLDYPVDHDCEALAEAVRRLAVPGARVVALSAIGNQANLFRFIAADALRSVAQTNAAQMSSLSLTEWWTTRTNCFVICTNEAEVEKALAALDENEKSSLDYAIAMTGELLRKQKQ